MTKRSTTGIFALSAALLFWAIGTCFSDQVDRDEKRAILSLRISQDEFPLTFGNQNVPEELKRRIAADLQYIFSNATSVVIREIEEWRVDEWHGYPVTHRLCELRSGKFYRLNSTTYPPVIRETFGYAVTISNEQHLIVHENLLADYRDILSVADKHPTMLDDLSKYLALLQDGGELEEIASDPEQEKEMVYCYRVSLDTGLSLFRAYVRDFSAARSLTIKQPSLLDIDSLRQSFQDEDAPSDVYVVSTVVSGQEAPDSEPFSERLPLGAYANGKWHVFAWPIP